MCTGWTQPPPDLRIQISAPSRFGLALTRFSSKNSPLMTQAPSDRSKSNVRCTVTLGRSCCGPSPRGAKRAGPRARTVGVPIAHELEDLRAGRDETARLPAVGLLEPVHEEDLL